VQEGVPTETLGLDLYFTHGRQKQNAAAARAKRFILRPTARRRRERWMSDGSKFEDRNLVRGTQPKIGVDVVGEANNKLQIPSRPVPVAAQLHIHHLSFSHRAARSEV
jgi:hypothetical protein